MNDHAEGRKGRKGKKSRTSEKDSQSDQNQEEDAEKAKEPPKPVILTEAPPPAVNPWAKRMEAQKAAVQAKLASDGTAADGEAKQNSSQEESNARSTMPNGVNGDKWAQKKPVEASRPGEQAQRRSGPRGSRAGDKDEKSPAALPLVADPSSWPDPKSAAEREQPARKTQEKTDTTEKDSQDEAGPTRKKTWEKLEIVHSVVFETQLPPLRGSKPRSGAPRAGREAGSMRGNNPTATAVVPQSTTASASDKPSPPGASTGPKAAATRPREGSVPSRATSQPQAPHPSKRSVDAVSRDQRKPSVPAGTAEQGRDTSLDASSVSFAFQQMPPLLSYLCRDRLLTAIQSSKRASATRDIRMENGTFEGGQTAGRTPPQERNNFQPRGEYAKDGSHGQYPARDGRPERGRGGGYRARGGHNTSSSHIPSASYGPNGHYAPNGFQPRQSPSAHSPPPFSSQFPTSFGHPSRGRGNKWTGSGQSAGRNNSGATGYPPKITPVNDFAVGQYPPYMYSPVFDASIPILKSQVEYYLSVENLCKDYYLRQHMDGQGFVHLATIAGFKRIKTVTEDLELVRLACSLSDQIEFGVGDDGIERLRPREKWQHFVLPVSERAEPFRHDGPANWTPYARPETHFVSPFPGPIIPQQYPPAAGGFPPFAEEQMYPPPFVNGAVYDPAVNGGAVNGIHHGHETRLSAGVPEYAPPQSPVTLESMTNFPDSQVENLMMILSYDEKDDTGSSDAAGVAGYVSHAGQNGVSSSAEVAR
jgi:la-related protein 1